MLAEDIVSLLLTASMQFTMAGVCLTLASGAVQGMLGDLGREVSCLKDDSICHAAGDPRVTDPGGALNIL